MTSIRSDSSDDTSLIPLGALDTFWYFFLYVMCIGLQRIKWSAQTISWCGVWQAEMRITSYHHAGTDRIYIGSPLSGSYTETLSCAITPAWSLRVSHLSSGPLELATTCKHKYTLPASLTKGKLCPKRCYWLLLYCLVVHNFWHGCTKYK